MTDTKEPFVPLLTEATVLDITTELKKRFPAFALVTDEFIENGQQVTKLTAHPTTRAAYGLICFAADNQKLRDSITTWQQLTGGDQSMPL